MARKNVSVEYNNFTKGFITEANPLTFPENASIDENNVNINIDGSRQRRFGMAWTDAAHTLTQTQTLVASGKATSSFAWLSAGNDGTQNLAVYQHGLDLYFYNLEDGDPTDVLQQTLTLSSSYASSTKVFQYTAAYGRLIIAAGKDNVVTLDYDGTTVTWTLYRLQVRDIWGIEDGLEVDTRSTSLTKNHAYNLRNQGFTASLRLVGDQMGSSPSTYGDPVGFTFSSILVYPSNADLVWSAKLTTIEPGGFQTDNIGAFSPWEFSKNHFGTTPAPQGRVVIDVFIRNNNTSSLGRYFGSIPLAGTGSLTTDQSSGYISSVAAFAGRIWYTLNESSLTGGDSRTPSIGNMVLYSQASEDWSRWGSCHSRNDPTSEDFSDTLASDGGFISIPEAGRIFKTVPLGSSLFVFASNGVWEIFGGDTTFSATSQSVQKITDSGAIGVSSIVTGGNFIGYWSTEGIYGISLSESTLRGIATNITGTTIQSFYGEIPDAQKRLARGVYDRIGKKALWLYTQTPKASDYYFDRELVFDVLKTSFTKRTLYPKNITTGPFITSAVSSLKRLVPSTAEQKTHSSMYYWTAHTVGTDENFRGASYRDTTFIDFPAISGGTDAEAHILTGYLTGGDSSRDKCLPYLSVKSKRTETGWSEDGVGAVTLIGESSCKMQVQWEWTNDPLSGKWATEVEVYRLPRFFALDNSHIFSFDVITTRNKVRGSGKALSVKFSSSPGKDMYLYGWGMEVELADDV